MHTLSGLSDQVLDQILASSSLDVATLWCAGNLALNNRIVRCCRTVRTDSRLSTSTLKKWPRMLSSLRSLEELVLDVYRFQESIHAVKSQLVLLSPSIKHLELRFVSASLLPLQSWQSGPEPPGDEANEVDIAHFPVYPTNRKYWDLKTAFPSLSSVAFVEKHDHKFRFVCPSFPSSSFSIFPPTLVSLSWTLKLDVPSSLSELPQDLTWLDFGPSQSTLSCDGRLALPPNLTHLNGLAFSNLADIAALPRSLVSGRFILAEFNDAQKILNLTQAHLGVFPPSMETLTGCILVDETLVQSGTTGSWAAHLPKKLKTLEILSPVYTPRSVAHLPRSITSMVEASLFYDDFTAEIVKLGREEALQIWPPNLRAISLANDWYSRMECSQLIIFPPTLTSICGLSVDSIQTLLETASTTLPPNLTRLQAFVLDSDTEQCTDIETKLPTTWTILKLGGAQLTIPAIRQLPRGLKTLHISRMIVSQSDGDAFIAALPPGLEELVLASLDEKVQYRLPRSITSLEIIDGLDYDPHSKYGALPSGVTRLMDYKTQHLYTRNDKELCSTRYSVWQSHQ